MKQILWFRRDLRISDSALLNYAKKEVFPIFIFDIEILSKLNKDDKRVTFIYNCVLKLKKELKSIGLDLAIFYDIPKNVFQYLKPQGFDSIVCSCDFDSYAISRDLEIEKIIPMERYYDSYILHPQEHLKSDGTPYKVFTPFYKSLWYLSESNALEELPRNKELKLVLHDYEIVPTLEIMGFKEQKLEKVFYTSADDLLNEFIKKIDKYKEDRDYFYKNATSNISTHLRFGLISPRQIFNKLRKIKGSEFYIRELFWREFYNYILYHFPYSQKNNFNQKNIQWDENEKYYKAWCDGNTGIPIIDAAMRHLNKTGMMHNRLRMIVSSFFTKNLLLDWRLAEQYFALKLMDYDASSNIGSWQWGASTGADASPYFRVFNPYLQSEKFDKEAIFIKSVIPALKDIDAKLLHKEGALCQNLFLDYPYPIIDIKSTRNKAIERFKNAN